MQYIEPERPSDAGAARAPRFDAIAFIAPARPRRAVAFLMPPTRQSTSPFPHDAMTRPTRAYIIAACRTAPSCQQHEPQIPPPKRTLYYFIVVISPAYGDFGLIRRADCTIENFWVLPERHPAAVFPRASLTSPPTPFAEILFLAIESRRA